MYVGCRGAGGPTVVLIAGYGNRCSVWSSVSPGVSFPAVLPGFSGFTRVCAYDRPGTIRDTALATPPGRFADQPPTRGPLASSHCGRTADTRPVSLGAAGPGEERGAGLPAPRPCSPWTPVRRVR